MSDEDIDKEFKKYKSEVEQDQEEVGSTEEDLKEREGEVESAEQSSGNEIRDAEQSGNQEELVDAENKVKRELEAESEIESGVEAVEEDLMEEADLEKKQEQLLEKMQERTESEVEDALNKLEQEKDKLLAAKNSEDTQIRPQDYQNIEQVLDEFRDAAGNTHRFTREIVELFQEIGRTEEEENNLENLTSQLPDELGFMENEIEELAAGFKKLQDSQHEKMAQKEREQLEKLEQRERRDEEMEQKIDQKLQGELREAENLVREDEQLVEIFDQSISELQELRRILEQEKSIWRFALNKNPPLDDVDNTISMMKKAMGEDRSRLQKAGDLASDLMERAPKGPSTRAGAGAGGKTRKWLIAALVVSLVVIYVLFQAPSLL